MEKEEQKFGGIDMRKIPKSLLQENIKLTLLGID